MKTPEIAESVFVAPDAVILGDVHIGEDCSIWFHTVIRAEDAAVRIGRGSNIQDNAVVHVDKGHPVTIGNQVTVGHGAIVHGCQIGDNTLIGMGAILLNGSIIGKNCIIGAGALVTQNTIVPDNSMVKPGIRKTPGSGQGSGKQPYKCGNLHQRRKRLCRFLPCKAIMPSKNNYPIFSNLNGNFFL